MKHLFSILVTILFTASIATAQNYEIGDLITNPDGSQGIVFYVNEDRTNGWMLALNDLEINKCGYLNHIPYIPGIDNPNDLLEETDGYWNTGRYRDFHHDYVWSYGAGMVDYDNGWYIPTAGQLMKLCCVINIINERLEQVGGTRLLQQYYCSSSEPPGDALVWMVDLGCSNHDWGGQFDIREKRETAYFRAVKDIVFFERLPIVGTIDIPASICEDELLRPQSPTTQYALSHGWQISPDANFTNPIDYNGGYLDVSYDGWFLRYFASNDFGTTYSNVVPISISPAYYKTFSVTRCNEYVWNEITYTESGTYSQLITSYLGCDTLATLYLDIIPAPHAPIDGPAQVYVATDLVAGLYEYHLDLGTQPYTSITWILDSEEWGLTPQGTNCQVYVATPQSATLKAIIENDGCASESTLTINASYFDIEEHDEKLVSVYPNPANDIINIAGEGIEEVRIYNLLGQNVLSRQGDGSNDIKISTSSLDAAIYLMEISTQRGKTVKRVTIIM